MDRLAPFDKIGVTPVPDHQNADPANGIQGSILNVLIFNQLQREGVNLEALAGLTPSSTDLTQWAQAVSRGGLWAGPLTGTGDLAVATLGATLPALLQGMRVGGVATAANTGTTPKLRVLNLGTAGGYTDFSILREDGSALAVGDIVSGRRYRFEADGAGNVVISGGGLGSGAGGTATTINTTLNAGPINALYLPSAPNTIASQTSVGTKLTAFGTAVNNVSDRLTWDPGTARMTVVKTGYYFIQMYLETNFALGNYGAFMSYNKNGSASGSGEVTAATSGSVLGPNFSAQTLRKLTAGDYYEFFCGQNSGSSQSAPVAITVMPEGV